MKKIDIHTHVLAFPEFCPPRPDGGKILSARQQLEVHEKLNVDKAVLLPSGGLEGQWHLISTESCMYTASQHPDHFLWFCNVDPRAGNYNAKTDLGYLLNYYKERGAKGLGELMAPINADDPMMDNLFGFCEQLEADLKKVPADDCAAIAKYYSDVILADMNLAREQADILEANTDKAFWPYPTYSDLLFY